MPKEVLMGNHATSVGVKLSRVQVISAYPITPQTQVVEELSEMVARGELNAKFIKVESEHSAMAAIIGAAEAGARAFTATSAQGLALMHELLFWAAYGRLPLVLVDVNRAMAPGWSIWSDQTDSLAQRDTGWIQLYCETNQEVLDTIIIAYKLAESVKLPVMVVYDAFILSHTYEPVDIPEQREVDDFLPPYSPDFYLEPGRPMAFSSLTSPDHYMEFRYIMECTHQSVHAKLDEIFFEFAKRFGREYGAVETYKIDDAETIIVASGSFTSTARVAIDMLRDRGEGVGLCKMKLFRPFPKQRLWEIFSKTKPQNILVLDRNISHGAGGIWSSEIKAAIYDMDTPPTVNSALIGLGGRDITPESIIKAYDVTKGRRTGPVEWIGLKE